MMPPIDPASDAVANGLVRVLGARGGDSDALRSLHDIYRFLGGQFVDHASYPYQLHGEGPPADRLERWRWLVESVLKASGRLDDLWRAVMDPAS